MKKFAASVALVSALTVSAGCGEPDKVVDSRAQDVTAEEPQVSAPPEAGVELECDPIAQRSYEYGELPEGPIPLEQVVQEYMELALPALDERPSELLSQDSERFETDLSGTHAEVRILNDGGKPAVLMVADRLKEQWLMRTVTACADFLRQFSGRDPNAPPLDVTDPEGAQ